VHQVDAENPERASLQLDRAVAERNVEQDVAGLRAGDRLEAETHPAVLLVVALEIPRRDGVREGEEANLGPARASELGLHGLVLALEHREQTLSRYVASSLSVALVAERLVVGADRLGDGPGCSAHAEKPVRDLLTRADLREGAVLARVQ